VVVYTRRNHHTLMNAFCVFFGANDLCECRRGVVSQEIRASSAKVFVEEIEGPLFFPSCSIVVGVIVPSANMCLMIERRYG